MAHQLKFFSKLITQKYQTFDVYLSSGDGTKLDRIFVAEKGSEVNNDHLSVSHKCVHFIPVLEKKIIDVSSKIIVQRSKLFLDFSGSRRNYLKQIR